MHHNYVGDTVRLNTNNVQESPVPGMARKVKHRVTLVKIPAFFRIDFSIGHGILNIKGADMLALHLAGGCI